MNFLRNVWQSFCWLIVAEPDAQPASVLHPKTKGSQSSSQLVEFVGGPFDGHIEWMELPDFELFRWVQVPVSRAIVQWLQGQLVPDQDPPTSVAIYELQTEGCRPRYVFCRHEPFPDSPPQSWYGHE